MKRLVLMVLGLILYYQGVAQDSLSTFNLEEVRIKGTPYQRYAAGSKVQTIDSVLLHNFSYSSLAAAIQSSTPVYIKEYGSGMLSSVSFRGTGASHTAVLWNGININSLNAGQTDFANIPLFLFNEIALQYGSASSLYGTDAIGGSVHLNYKTPTFDKFQLGVQQEVGSFGEFFSGIKSNYRWGNLTGSTKIYRYQAENDFPFRNTRKTGTPTEKQTNAGILYYGLLQSLTFQPNAKQQFTLDAWYHQNDRELQPNMVNLFNRDQQEDDNFRTIITYDQVIDQGNFQAKLGYLHDEVLYNQTDLTTSSSILASLSYETELFRLFTMNVGADWRNVTGNSDNYEGKNNENRSDLYFSFNYNPSDFWKLTLNGRQAFVTGFSAPFAPSLGSELTLYKRDHHQLILNLLAGRSYRIPTLNDRYWSPGGNPDIKPEDGYNAEGGFLYNYNHPKFTISSDASFYQLWVNNWIIWVPMGSYWSPENIREVHAHGVEWNGKVSSQIRSFQWTIGGNFAYTRSVNQKGMNEYDQSVGKQLPYTPIQTASTFGQIGYKKLFLFVQGHYTGYRYITTDNTDFLDGYFLLNTKLSYREKLKDSDLIFEFGIKNLFNTTYQNVNNYAMPGRSFQLSINYQLIK